jgi:hypothetical protein
MPSQLDASSAVRIAASSTLSSSIVIAGDIAPATTTGLTYCATFSPVADAEHSQSTTLPGVSTSG